MHRWQAEHQLLLAAMREATYVLHRLQLHRLQLHRLQLHREHAAGLLLAASSLLLCCSAACPGCAWPSRAPALLAHCWMSHAVAAPLPCCATDTLQQLRAAANVPRHPALANRCSCCGTAWPARAVPAAAGARAPACMRGCQLWRQRLQLRHLAPAAPCIDQLRSPLGLLRCPRPPCAARFAPS